jgi:FkbM family methyltransferase
MAREAIPALTSLSPAPAAAPHIRDCIHSWREAGFDVLAFNHPSEIPQLRESYDVQFVPVVDTAASIFGRHCVPITAIATWAAGHDGPVLIVNSDIRLASSPWEIDRLHRLSEDGLCYFVRHNHDGVVASAALERFGIDAFLFRGRHAPRLPGSFLSMGQPFWDYLLPHAFGARGRPTYAVEFPAAFHLSHQNRWSWNTWQRCALEFDRVTGALNGGDDSLQSCLAMSWRVRQSFDDRRIAIRQRPPTIRDWVQRKFGDASPKLFLELGAHCGTDTTWLADLPGVTIHAFEPDPRNHQPARTNVTLHRAAIAEHDGRGPLILSREGWGREWTYSSSIKAPKNHLHRFPVTFGAPVEVELVTLDSFCRERGLDVIDLIWADVQGAEGELIRGGRRALRRTRYLYTEYSDDELYEGQPTLAEILALLPDFRVVELWPEDVLLENRSVAP